MRKAKKKSAARVNKPAAKIKGDQTPALKERIEAEFAQAVKTARAYVGNPER